MSLLRSLSDGRRSLFRKERVEEDCDEELRGLLELAAEEKMKEALSRKEALRTVRLQRRNLPSGLQRDRLSACRPSGAPIAAGIRSQETK